jgi:hypothetical protein
MSVCLLAIGDGRTGYHERSWASLSEMLPDVDHTVVIDDTGHKLGFSGAIAEGWRQVLDTGASWVFHAELDFTYREPIALDAMIVALQQRPRLAQICLKRGPVNAEEIAAGGIVERFPDRYRDEFAHGYRITVNDVCFSTNPCVYPVEMCRKGWPQEKYSEGVFTHRLLAEGYEFAFWGGKFAAPKVRHIGDVRSGSGY